MSRFWDAQPLHTSIVETLLKKGGELTDSELYSILKSDYKDLSFRELNRTMMRLEVDGIINVFRLMKNKRRVVFRKV